MREEDKEGGITKGHEGTLGDHGYIYYLDCNDGLFVFFKCKDLFYFYWGKKEDK